ncbi:MAG TPA: two-component regulator propeller domain-containing protein [Vicinamibacterales bacterium]|nr:two-component regulator propeller domain-containing protein [Vicinamibacterales bacterium]
MIAAVVTLLAARFATASSLQSTKAISQLTHTAWTAESGIPGPVRAIQQTPDGYLWLGTEAGLYRFDGLRFMPWTSSFGERLLSGSVWSLCVARDGSLWIGLGSSGISHLQMGHVRNYTPIDGAPEGGVLAIVEDLDGAIWAGGQYGFSKYERGIWRRIGDGDGYPAPGAQSLLVDRDGSLWAATDGLNFGLGKNPFLRNTILRLPRHGSRFVGTGHMVSQVVSMTAARDGAGWFADSSQGAIRPLDGPPGGGLLFDALTGCALFDDDGDVWVGGSSGLWRTNVNRSGRDGSAHETFTFADGLSGTPVYAAYRDREGNRWFGTANGLDRFRDNKVTAFSMKEGLVRDARLAVTSAGPRGFWVFSYSYNTLQLFDGNVFTPVVVRDYAPNEGSRLLSIFADRAGRTFVGGSFKLAQEADARFTFVHDEIESGANVEGIVVDGTGSLWISETRWDTKAGTISAPKVLRLHGGQWTDLSAHGQLPPYKSRVLHADAHERVWLGFENGEVALYEHGAVRRFSTADGLPRGRILAIADDREGNVWIGGEGGLSRFDRGRFLTLSRENGLPGGSVAGIVEDDAGNLWLACALGILRVSPSELQRALASPSYRVQGLVIGVNDGLRGLPRQNEPFPVAARGANGTLVFATTRGIALIDPRHLVTNSVPPPVVIESVTADDRTFPPTRDLRLTPATRIVEFTYTALSLTDPERVQFRYRLEGYDDDWRGPVTQRQLRYTNLPPRAYRFRLQASNNDGLWNEEGATLAFTVLPAFYQTTAFRTSVGLFILTVGVLAYRMRVASVARRLNIRYEERLGERERIARELHDTLLQGIYGLILRFQAVADRIPQAEPARALINDALERADQMVVEGRNRVEDLRSANRPLDLAQSFTDVGEQLAAGSRTTLNVAVEGPPRDLRALVRDEVYWIGREALINAFQAADANRVEVELILARRELRLLCRDDGKGIDPSILRDGGRPGHFGIRGMRERAKKIGGTLEISSRAGAGTEVDLRVPRVLAYAQPSRSWTRWWRR